MDTNTPIIIDKKCDCYTGCVRIVHDGIKLEIEISRNSAIFADSEKAASCRSRVPTFSRYLSFSFGGRFGTGNMHEETCIKPYIKSEEPCSD